MGWYERELAEQQARRDRHEPRIREESPGFAGQSEWGAAEQPRSIDPDANPDEDGDHSEVEDAKAQAFGDLYDAILDGKAPEDVIERAKKCAMDCARMTGRPVSQFLTDAARTVAISVIYGS